MIELVNFWEYCSWAFDLAGAGATSPEDGGACRVEIRLPGKGNSNSHGARPVHQIISIRTSRLSIKKFLSAGFASPENGGARHSRRIPPTLLTYSLSLSHSHSHTQTQIHTLSLSDTHSYLGRIHPTPHTRTLFLSLSFSRPLPLSNTHTHTHALSLSRTHTHALVVSPPPLTHMFFFSGSISLTLFLSLSHTHSHSHSLPYTHSCPRRMPPPDLLELLRNTTRSCARCLALTHSGRPTILKLSCWV